MKTLPSRLVQWLEKRKPKSDDGILFPVSKKTRDTDRKTSGMIEFDLASAKRFWIDETDDEPEKGLRERNDFLMYKNKDGLFADFHGLRHTFVSDLAKAGVAPKTAQIRISS